MRHHFPKLSPQAALIESSLEEIDKTLSEDFIITRVQELSPIGIDRIFFLQFVQFSVFYIVEYEESYPADLAIPLKDSDDQLTWPYQSMAQWLVIASVPSESISVFSMIDFKTRLTNWKIRADSSDTIYVPWAELSLFALKRYQWKLPEPLVKKFVELKWVPSSSQQSKQQRQPR